MLSRSHNVNTCIKGQFTLWVCDCNFSYHNNEVVQDSMEVFPLCNCNPCAIHKNQKQITVANPTVWTGIESYKPFCCDKKNCSRNRTMWTSPKGSLTLDMFFLIVTVTFLSQQKGCIWLNASVLTMGLRHYQLLFSPLQVKTNRSRNQKKTHSVNEP